MITNGLQGYADVAHWIAEEHGFYDDEFTVETALSKIALCHSELSETLEAIRKDQGSAKIAEELSDTIIRVADLYRALQDNGYIDANLSFDTAVSAKMAYNRTRPMKHGNLA